jgi:hypothetical protein
MSIKKSILFFIAGAIPTAVERAAAEKLGTAKFRNVRYVDDTAPEVADGYAGKVPQNYRDKFPGKVIEEAKTEEAPEAPAPAPKAVVASPSTPAADDAANTPAPGKAKPVAKAPAKGAKGK